MWALHILNRILSVEKNPQLFFRSILFSYFPSLDKTQLNSYRQQNHCLPGLAASQSEISSKPQPPNSSLSEDVVHIFSGVFLVSIPFNPQSNTVPAVLQAAFCSFTTGLCILKSQQVSAISATCLKVWREQRRVGHTNTLFFMRVYHPKKIAVSLGY